MYRSCTRFTPSIFRSRRFGISGDVPHDQQRTAWKSGRQITKHLSNASGDTLVARFPAHVYMRMIGCNGAQRYFSGGCDDKNEINSCSSLASKDQDTDRKEEVSESLGETPPGPQDHQQAHESTLEGTEQGVGVPQEETTQPESDEAKLRDPGKRKGDRSMSSLKGKFKKKLTKNLVSWDKISESFENFPYYLNEHTRDLLVESTAARLWHHNQTKFGKPLRTSSHLILLSGPAGTEIYQEKLVRALAHHLQTSLLVLDSELLAEQHFKEESTFTESEMEEDNSFNPGNGRRIWTLSSVDMDDANDDDGPSSKKHMPGAKTFVQTLEQLVGFPESASERKEPLRITKEADDDDDEDSQESPKHAGIKLGDRVRYIGCKDEQSTKPRSMPKIGQQGLVTFISEAFNDKVEVKFELGGRKGGANPKKNNSCIIICEAKDLEKVDENHFEKQPWMTLIEAFAEFASSSAGVIIFFPDMQKWLARAVPSDEQSLFLHTLSDYLNKFKGPAVFIAGRMKEASNTSGSQWSPMKSLLSSMRGTGFRRFRVQLRNEKEEDMKGMDEVYDIFKNVIPILPPQESDLLREWREQLDHDKKKILLKSNTKEILKVLSENAMKCLALSELDTSDLQLTEKQAQKIVGWARNICLTDGLGHQKGRYLYLPRLCLDKAVTRFRAVEKSTQDKSNSLKSLAENEYESELVSSVVRAKEIGVGFDQIGALEDVKNTLKELIILPLKRPELFKKGNLRKPCKGVLLFGPPGTGKTLLAKAVATEAGANFMSINTSNITSKWFGDAEKLARSLFTLAKKLEPAIIFIDEVDGILRARGDASEHEASRRVRNELMAAWDGLQSKESERILVLATTNRPFDLDDAVIRRLPRRIFVDLPDVKNREKILHVLLADEDLGGHFSFHELASQTEGFSGSDLKNLCVAAAYRPIREFLEAEQQEKADGFDPSVMRRKDLQINLRPLCLDDFIQAKSKVGMSVTYDASSMVQMRQWNEQYGEGGSRAKSVFGFIN